jgi:hypothetical protein
VEAALTSLDNSVAHWLIGICCLATLLALIFALRDWHKSKFPVLVLLIIGGAVTCLAEPFVDLLGACWHPIVGQNTLFELMDRPMPIWLMFAYIAYFGVLMMYLYRAFSSGATIRAMWLWFLVPVIADIVLEEFLMGLSDNLYIYYGNQPLRLHVFPIWWTQPNTMGIYLSAVAMTLLVPHLRGWRMALIPFSTILCYAAAAGVVSFPAVVVINSAFPDWITQLGGIACFLIAMLIVHGCTLLIASDSPYNVREACAPKVGVQRYARRGLNAW